VARQGTGEIAGIVIFAEEVTERKRAEQGLRESFNFDVSLDERLDEARPWPTASDAGKTWPT
jgi:signal transduction histidine kinase